VPDPVEAEAVARARELHGEGASLRQIASALTVEGAPTQARD
jgi:hypothetical protein